MDRVVTVPWTRQGARMGIREQMILARDRAKISQAKLEEFGWDRGNVSKFENGQKGASIASIDKWMEACGMELVIVPRGPIAEPAELASLRTDLREILLRLARILPRLPEALIRDLRGRVETWDRDYPPVPVSTRAITQDTTDSLS